MAKNIRIAGLVQGVGYRVAFTTQARALKLSGWVRNRLDGSVEASVAGETQALTHIIAWAEHGPAGAQVQSVSVSDVAEGLIAEGEFRILPSA